MVAAKDGSYMRNMGISTPFRSSRSTQTNPLLKYCKTVLRIQIFNLLLTVNHFSGFCKQVYLATARGKISRIDTKFIWFERALRV